VAVLAGRAEELVQLDPPSVETANSPGSVGTPPVFVPTARHEVVVGRQSAELNVVFMPVIGSDTHVAPPSTVLSRPDPAETHEEL
jgi:hypothetical protein